MTEWNSDKHGPRHWTRGRDTGHGPGIGHGVWTLDTGGALHWIRDRNIGHGIEHRAGTLDTGPGDWPSPDGAHGLVVVVGW